MMRRPRPNRERRLSLPQLLPNLLTLGAICAGLTSIRFSIDGRINEAVALIVLAAILDGIDGRLARMLRSESAIGAELDSLADFLNFGVAAGMLVFLSMLGDMQSLGWVAALIYVIGCVLRLARFNVDARNPLKDTSPPQGKFLGVPSPAGALLAMMPIFAERAMDAMFIPAQITAAWLVLVAMLLVSRIPTPSLKLLRIRAEYLPHAIIAIMALIATLFTWPWATLLAADLIYLGILSWAVIQYRRGKAKGTSERET